MVSGEQALLVQTLLVQDLRKHYTLKKLFGQGKVVKAVDGVSFALGKNETLAIVGESGCGKSSLARVLMALELATSGQVLFHGQDVATLDKKEFRREVQMVFQDPYGSLNPRKKISEIIAEPLIINTELAPQERRAKVAEVMLKVGLRAELMERYPHMFSGGQRQRIGLARALIMNPKILICDEPVSALDISVQAQVLNLFMEMQQAYQLSCLFISHDLSVVQHIADRVLVMYLGKVVELGTRDQIFSDPQHPYTQALLASVPKVRSKTRMKMLEGELPSPLNPPPGCAFHRRCAKVENRCLSEAPVLASKKQRQISCHVIS